MRYPQNRESASGAQTTVQATPRRAPQIRPDQILDAATEVLLAKGLANTTVDDIANAAGLAKGTMYLYFKSKAQVLAALRLRHVQRMLVACAAAADRGRSASTIVRIERFIETVYDFAAEHAQLLHLLFHEAGLEDENEIGMARDGLLLYVRQGISNGELRVQDPELVVSFLVYGMHGVFAASLDGSDPAAARRRVLTGLRQIIRALLQPQEPENGSAPRR